jgi:hypothetical protein
MVDMVGMRGSVVDLLGFGATRWTKLNNRLAGQMPNMHAVCRVSRIELNPGALTRGSEIK